MISRRRLLGGALALGASASAFAQIGKGGGPIRFIVPFGPGSGTDSSARMFAKAVGEVSGIPVIVENKPGANGFIAVQTVLAAPPDGRTILLGSNTTLSTNAVLFKAPPYDPLRDLEPISVLTRANCLVVVPSASPYQSLADLIADARKNPGKLNNGSGSPSYELYSAWFNELTKIDTVNVPYKGAGEAITAAVGAQVDYAITDSSASMELVLSGRLRALCFAGEKRSPLLPQVPTCAEAGVPGFVAFNWVAAAAPVKTPAPALEQLRTWFRQAGEHPDIQAYYARPLSQLLMSDSETMRRYQRDEIVRWKRLVTISGMQVQ